MAATSRVEDSVFVYDVFKGAEPCRAIERLLDRPQGDFPRTVLLSVENGRTFVLDDGNGEKNLACVLDRLHARGHSAKALALQDTVFLTDVPEARRRVTLLNRFAARHPGLVSSVVVDVEPHTVPGWACASAQRRREVAASFHAMLRSLKEAGRLPVEAVVPWWFSTLAADDALSLDALGRSTDGLYLMFYGDPGGPVVNGTAASIVARMDAGRLATISVPVYVVLATYEARSPESEREEKRSLVDLYGGRRAFAGVSVFLLDGAYDVPRQLLLSGTVTDAAGAPVTGAHVAFAGDHGETDMCGSFLVRAAPGRTDALVVTKGAAAVRVQPTLHAPGQITDLGTIVLH